MAWPLRIEFAGALYHVTARGNARQDIYDDDADRRQFLNLLAQVVERYDWYCHAHCLMGNHYHLLLETGTPSLAKGMRLLNGSYTQHYNQRHRRVGHLLQGRYKANIVNDGVFGFTYSDRGRLASVATAGGTVNYLYNGRNLRAYKSGPTAVVPTGAAYYLYDEAGQLLGEYDANGNPVYETIYVGMLPVGALKQTGSAATSDIAVTLYNVSADHIATPRMITRQDETIVWRWDSAESFGGTLPDQDPSGLGTFTYNQRFPGQVFDQETGLFQNWNREYNSRYGRYIQSDPIGLKGGINTFAYVGGNPLTAVDAMGLEACPGGVWDEEVGDFGFTLAAGGFLSVTKVHYTCRSKPSVKFRGTQTCIGGGPMVAAGVGWTMGGTAYGANDSSDLGGWARHQGQFVFGPFGVQAPVNGDPGGSGNIGKGIGLGAAYSSCYTKPLPNPEPPPCGKTK